MRVKKIHARAFMSHDDTTVDLPETGVVLVDGKNGSGKSNLIEAVSVAAFGKTLRGSDPWREGEKGEVAVQADAATMVRRCSAKGKKSLQWKPPGGAAGKHATATKAQAALEEVVGDFDCWRRTHVFSSHDASHFTMATDAERKRLLERLLGLERFDAALAACRADKAADDRELQAAEASIAKAEGKLEGEQARLRDAEAALAEIETEDEETKPEADESEPAPDAPSHDQIDVMVREKAETAEKVGAARERLRALSEQVGKANALAEQAAKRLERIDVDECDRCGQPIPSDLREDLRGEADREKDKAHDVREQLGVEARALKQKIELLSEEAEAQAGQIREVRAAAQAAADIEERNKERSERHAKALLAWEERRTARAGRLQRAGVLVREVTAALVDVEDGLDVERSACADLAAKRDALAACEQVLGLRGVRAHVLGKALGGIEAVANLWLGRLADGMVVGLKPYSEKKTGGVTDSISMEIEGLDGSTYKSASGGERRRIDVALLLALADVAAAARGVEPGTIFVDECFDALDADGTERVAEIIREMARQRTVVVISHSDELADALVPDLHLHVDGGVVMTAEQVGDAGRVERAVNREDAA